MNRRNKFKGMTLSEVIIALAVFAMLGVILVRLGMNVDATSKSSNRLNKRVAVQAPYAASQSTNYVTQTLDSEGNPVISNSALTANFTNIEVYIDQDGTDKKGDGNPDTISVKRKGSSTEEEVNSDIKIYGNRYSTKEIVTDNSEVYRTDEVSNSDHHLQFINIIERMDVNVEVDESNTKQLTYFDSADLDEDGNPIEKNLTGITWTGSASSADYATIDDSGLITGIKVGSCVYKGINTDDGRRFLVTITVK